MPPAPRLGALNDDTCRTSDVCLSVAYIGPNSRTERPRKGRPKLAQRKPTSRHTWLGHHFQGQKVKGQLSGGGGYCGGLLHSLFLKHPTELMRWLQLWIDFYSTPCDSHLTVIRRQSNRSRTSVELKSNRNCKEEHVECDRRIATSLYVAMGFSNISIC